MQIFALFMICGLCTSFLVPETARKTLEELSGDEPAPASQLEGPTEGEKENGAEEGAKEVTNISTTLNS